MTLGVLGTAGAELTPEEELRMKALEEQVEYLRGKESRIDLPPWVDG